MSKTVYVGNLPVTATEQDVTSFLHKNETQIKSANVSKLCHDTFTSIFVIEGGMPDTLVEILNGRTIAGKKIVATLDRRALIKRKEDWTWV